MTPVKTGSRFEAATVRRWLPAIVAAVLFAAVAAMLIGRELIAPDPPDRPARPASDFVRFRDPATGISIAQPANWRRISSADPQVRLVAEGDGSSMLVRTADLGVDVGLETLGPAKKISDRLVRSVARAKLLRSPQQVTLGGLPGYLYLYTFPDAPSGQRGAHAHYFLFRGRTLITIIFQTIPAERLAQLAPLFDRIGETLRVS